MDKNFVLSTSGRPPLNLILFSWLELYTTIGIGCQTCIPIGAYSLLLNWPECGRCPTLINHNEWNLTVRRRGSSNHHIFVMLWVDSNHLPPELQASALNTHLMNSLYTYSVHMRFSGWLVRVHTCSSGVESSSLLTALKRCDGLNSPYA